MKANYICLILLLSISFLVNAQEVEVTLDGHTSGDGFSVLDDNSNTLLRVTGEGNVGIGTNNPNGTLDVQGGHAGPSDGTPINIVAQTGFTNGGEVNITSGSGSNSGDLNITSGSSSSHSGDVNIATGIGGFTSGDINIKTASGNGPGNINIETLSSNMLAGHILISSGWSVDGGGGITLQTGTSSSFGSHINLICFQSRYCVDSSDCDGHRRPYPHRRWRWI